MKWVSVEDETPPTDTLLLVVQDGTGLHLRSFSSHGGIYDDSDIYDDSGLKITHWMLLPQVPELWNDAPRATE